MVDFTFLKKGVKNRKGRGKGDSQISNKLMMNFSDPKMLLIKRQAIILFHLDKHTIKSMLKHNQF